MFWHIGFPVTIGLLVAASFFPALRLERPKRTLVWAGLSLLILGLPVFFPAKPALLQSVCATLSVLFVIKMYDVHRAVDAGWSPDFRSYLGFLPNCFSAVMRKLEAEPSPSLHQNLVDCLRGCVLCFIFLQSFIWLLGVNWNNHSFALEHAAKTLTVYLAGVHGLLALAAGWRLAGGKARTPFDAPYLALTPADFWRRHNRVVQQFFYEDIFRPAGGRRSPVRITLLVFAVSALIHEYAFGLMVGGPLGYQTLFFMLQGGAAVATLRYKPTGWWKIPCWGLTFAFNLASSVLFMVNMNALLPFYSRGLPTWLK